jgi:hypothetical protein
MCGHCRWTYRFSYSNHIYCPRAVEVEAPVSTHTHTHTRHRHFNISFIMSGLKCQEQKYVQALRLLLFWNNERVHNCTVFVVSVVGDGSADIQWDTCALGGRWLCWHSVGHVCSRRPMALLTFSGTSVLSAADGSADIQWDTCVLGGRWLCWHSVGHVSSLRPKALLTLRRTRMFLSALQTELSIFSEWAAVGCVRAGPNLCTNWPISTRWMSMMYSNRMLQPCISYVPATCNNDIVEGQISVVGATLNLVS